MVKKEFFEKLKNLSTLDKKILGAAFKEFENKGYYKANVENIAASVGIGKGTVYRHFGNKIELFLSVIVYLVNSAYERFGKVESKKSFEETLDAYINQLVQATEEAGRVIQSLAGEKPGHFIKKGAGNRELFKKVFEYYINQFGEATRLLREILEMGKAEGKISKDINTRILSEVIVILISHFVRSYHFYCDIKSELGMKREYSLEDGIKELKKFIKKGLNAEGF